MQLDRAEVNALRQVDDDELPPALGQLQREDQPIRPGRHRLDTGAARNVYRRGSEPPSNPPPRAPPPPPPRPAPPPTPHDTPHTPPPPPPHHRPRAPPPQA